MKNISILNIIAACVFSTHIQAATPQQAPASLTATIRTALNAHPRLLAAQGRLAAAEKQLIASSQAIFNPELELDTERTADTTSSLQLSQTLDMGNRRSVLTKIGRASLSKAKAEYQLSYLELQHDLLSVLVEVQTSRELLQLSSGTLALMKEFTQIAKLRYQAGDINRSELNLASLAYTEAVLENARAHAKANAATENYKALYQTVPASLIALPKNPPQITRPDDLDHFMAMLPAIKIQNANVTIARHQVLLRQSEKKVNPTISIRGGKEGDDSLVGLTLSVPLNIRNTYRAEVEVARKKLYEAEQSSQQELRDYRARIIAATEQFSYLNEAWTNWRNSGEVSVSSQLSSTKRLWRGGDMNTAEYLMQLKQIKDTQASGLQLQNELWQSALEWLLVTSRLDNWLNITTETN